MKDPQKTTSRNKRNKLKLTEKNLAELDLQKIVEIDSEYAKLLVQGKY